MLLSQQSNSNLVLDNRIDNIPLQQYEAGTEITIFDSGMWQVYRGIVQLSKISLARTINDHKFKKAIASRFRNWECFPKISRHLSIS